MRLAFAPLPRAAEGDLEAERVRSFEFAKQAKALQQGYSDLSDQLAARASNCE